LPASDDAISAVIDSGVSFLTIAPQSGHFV